MRIFLVAAALVVGGALFACSEECERGDANCDGSVAAVCVDAVDSELVLRRHWARTDCSGRRCVTIDQGNGGHDAFCALATTVDARCPPSTTSEARTVCDKNTLLTCRAGFVADAQPCAGTCITPRDTGCDEEPFCALSASPDPLCADGAFNACIGDEISRCVCGLREAGHACTSPGPHCVVLSPAPRQVVGCR